MEEYVIVLIATFCFMAVINCIFLIRVIILKQPLNRLGNLFLILIVSVLTLKVGNSVPYYFSDQIAPFAFTFGIVGKLVLGPLLFFLIQSNQTSNFPWFNGLHFLPALVVLSIGWNFEFIPLLLVSNVSTLLVGVYLALSWYTYYANSSRTAPDKLQIEKPVLMGTSIIWISFVIHFLYYDLTNYIIGTFVSVLVLYWINYCMIIITLKKNNTKKTKTVSPKKTKLILSLIDQSFVEEKIYRDPKLTLNKLAEHINQPVYVISMVINKTYNKTFPEFVNHYRVEALKKELMKFSTTGYTIEGMAYSVGFNTPSAFYAAFKKELGVTPQQFITKHLNKIENRN